MDSGGEIMVSERRRAILKERQRIRELNLPKIIVTLDNEKMVETEDVMTALHFIREHIFRKPFWEMNTLKLSYYKKPKENEMYLHKDDPDPKPSNEKNLMFKDDKRKYVCIRCKRETEVCGFCSKCYPEVYGLESKRSEWMLMEDIKCNDVFINVVKNDPEYTEQIKQSILEDGMKNPIIIDEQNRILIGHHRYYIAKELGWERIEVICNPVKFGHDFFEEGKGYNLFVTRIDNHLVGSTVDEEHIYTTMRDFDATSMGKTLEIECFVNVGSDIRLRNIFIPERGHIVDQTWKEWWLNKYGKEPR